ncbi:DUF2326 domain-containing protein [Rhodobacteraceae bacterium B1Z28]|uniref:DUF2326 domain-containing protein n=1 Tax=Ruegeria haliotis TaxID=2747601 RepID=A0ABX2PS60_9RHOB|nr:DUF2326 domain-containing protein [Ruegeria haliotis]NVO56027.1 DUF2326 domain-containing protein [Ruegeria haliotis]
MLTEIRCNKFKTGTIKFHPGFNVVLGDQAATNSIGKSNLLMIVDFAFGGDSFLRHNSDVPKELGHHDYRFCFRFGDKLVHFVRNTATPNLVHQLSEDSEDETPISIEDYRTFLKAAYSLDDVKLTFRSITSPFSRIWGKDNLDVKQPLHSHAKETSASRIDNLIKLYKKYDEIEALSDSVRNLADKKKTVNSAYKQNLIPKSTKSEYKNNLQLLSEVDAEIKDIKNNLAKYAISIGEIVNREVLELKETRDALLGERDRLSANLSRVKRDLSKNRYIKSKAFKNLEKFFPEANFDRFGQIETFHSKIASILRDELRASEKELTKGVQEIENSIASVDLEISEALGNVDEPTVIVDRVHELAVRRSNATREIDYFETDKDVTENLRDERMRLAEERNSISAHISNIINNKIRKLVDDVYDEHRKSPTLEIANNSYSFSAVEDTGTGKAYSNLILLDLAILQTTVLPFVIHDSVLFKNIENEAVARLVELYVSFNRQTFIAIDEIQKYGAKAEAILTKQKVIQLSNENQLYIKDWRS